MMLIVEIVDCGEDVFFGCWVNDVWGVEYV